MSQPNSIKPSQNIIVSIRLELKNEGYSRDLEILERIKSIKMIIETINEIKSTKEINEQGKEYLIKKLVKDLDRKTEKLLEELAELDYVRLLDINIEQSP